MNWHRLIGCSLIATLPTSAVVAYVDCAIGVPPVEGRDFLESSLCEPGWLEVEFEHWKGHPVTLELLLASVGAALVGVVFLAASPNRTGVRRSVGDDLRTPRV